MPSCAPQSRHPSPGSRCRHRWCFGLLLTALLLVLLPGRPVHAQPMETPAPASAPERANEPSPSAPEADTTLSVHNRKIVTFRATLLGDSPSDRAMAARAAVQSALNTDGEGQVTRADVGDAVRFQIDGKTVFFLVAGDLGSGRNPSMLEIAAKEVEDRLRKGVRESHELTDPRQLLSGAAYSLLAIGLTTLGVRLLFAGRRRFLVYIADSLERWRRRQPSRTLAHAYAEYAGALARMSARIAASLLAWGSVLLLIDLCVNFVLRQFAYTRPWGERSRAWMLGLLEEFALAIAGAIPGLLTAALIFMLARLVSRSVGVVLQRIERGELQGGWLDTDTARPTRRIGNVAIWLFAFAMAYPYLPGADSEAFQGVSVLAGLMLTLGASSVVGQAMAGLSLMYSRALRVGEYVKIGDTEGTVAVVGLFATRIQTGMGEEVSLPNAVITSQPVRNFSRLGKAGQLVLHTAVTIGYVTPWRQVHAMLLEAAHRTEDIVDDPPPFVIQTALSDYYVEYRLCAQSNRIAPDRRTETLNQLHGHIQDVFNEHGVQIMSPHYVADPPEPQLVPPGTPFGGPAVAEAAAPAPRMPRDGRSA